MRYTCIPEEKMLKDPRRLYAPGWLYHIVDRKPFRCNQLMLEKDRIMESPAKQRMERQETLAREHSEEYKAAFQRAATLSVPRAYSPSSYGTFD
ncbi:uncharacterized protein LOC111281068 [Durio zibethinus]|uniref:Uncharacterized protein LOC111281068 n=1 Tax=Durio zibethinus TaxID=66656 RepID=A0A6P5X994_DURZI|nr:uncharacterized protein LOC111281068 [Durio zibethinus]